MHDIPNSSFPQWVSELFGGAGGGVGGGGGGMHLDQKSKGTKFMMILF